MIKFAHIAPKSCMREAMRRSGIHMALYHLTGDDKYNEFFRSTQDEVIMDNSFYELGKCPSVAELIMAARRVHATYVVLADGTLDGIDEIREAGFKVMAIPAGPDMSDLFKAWMRDDRVDLVGISFFHSRLAVGSDNKYDSGARFNFLRQFSENELFGMQKKIHCLGMGDTVHEVQLLRPYWYLINSWDSSAAVWAGLHGQHVSRTRVKLDTPVEFDTLLPFDGLCSQNIQYVNRLVEL